MQQLTALDASFLYLETQKTPMHIGGVYIFEPPAWGDMTFDLFRKHIESRLHISRSFRQRIVYSPLNLGHPYWIEDPEFNLNLHINRISLPKPGGKKELKQAAAQIFAKALDRNRPLWEINFVEGLESLEGMEKLPKGSFALITKVHHAAIDGVSGAEMMGALLDLDKEPKRKEMNDGWKPEKIPSGWQILAKNYWQNFGTPFQVVRYLYDITGTAYSSVKDIVNKSLQPPPFAFTPPPTPFNVNISGNRVFGGVEIPLERIKEIKNKKEGMTVNDVVLAICSGGMRKYLKDRGELPAKSMVSMAPISVRAENEKGHMGNKVSAMLVSLATNEADPVRRLRLIHESSRASKVYSSALGANQIMDFIPSSLTALAARLYVSWNLTEKHGNFFNLVTTNVPGPNVPLYLNGAKLIHQFGMAPILDGWGLLIVILSYAGTITISVTSTPEIIPDLDKFLNDIYDSSLELHEVVVGTKEVKQPIKKDLGEETLPKPEKDAPVKTASKTKKKATTK